MMLVLLLLMVLMLLMVVAICQGSQMVMMNRVQAVLPI